VSLSSRLAAVAVVLLSSAPAAASDTPVAMTEIGPLLARAHRRLFGVPPSPERLLVAWSHVALETARGERCRSNNVGNIVVTLDWTGAENVIRVEERVRRDPDVWRPQEMRFRAYATLDDGAEDYWRVVGGRFGSALARFDGGDAGAAGRTLCTSGYATADCDAYGKGMEGLYRWMRSEGWERAVTREPAASMTDVDWLRLEREQGIACCVVVSG
jgi:flagellum-specific peptidoglycan hydrolase FlgJ